MSKVISPLKSSPAGLKPLTKLHFDVEMVEIDELFTPEMVDQLKREKRSTKNFAVLHPKEGLAYGCSDGIFTYKLMPVLREKMSEGDIKIYNLEKSFCNVLREMERNRVHIDVERVNQLDVECRQELDRVGDVIRELIEAHTKRSGKWLTLNIGSPKQLSMALITDPEGVRLKPTPEMIAAEGGEAEWEDDEDDDDGAEKDEEQKQYSLKDEALKSMDRAYGKKLQVRRDGKEKPESLFELILEWRHYQKMKGSYVEKLVAAVDKNGDVRPSFNQMGTETARLSCKADKIENGYSGVNFQGIPRDSDEDKPELFKQIRTCIVPRPGWALVKLDYAGEELRVVTNLSGDPIWTKSFLYEDGDVHSITARTLFGKADVNKDERNRGKRCNFAFIYGGGSGAIQRNIGCSMEDAQRHMNNLRSDVPVLMGYVDHQKAYAKKYKYVLTAFGRKLPIPTIDHQVRSIRSKAERCAINYTIQSTSADIIKFAMCFVDKQLRNLGWKDRCRYVLTVHDEVVFEIKPEHLMEVVRKLDEWMTLPWKLPKAHGRPWVVPLLTEPGIDINWKARFNYFEMVDGLPVKESDIDADGNYTGKVKKGYFFADGRIYQKVPDFLEGYIKRILPEGLKASEAPKLPEAAAPALPEAAVKPAEEEPMVETKEPEPQNVEPAPDPEPAPVTAPSPSAPAPSPSAPPPVQATAEGPDLSFDDISLDVAPTSFSDVPTVPEPESQKPSAPRAAPAPPKATNGTNGTNGTYKPTNGVKHDEPGVVRWTIRAVLSEYNMRRLHAVCILCEGETPLRILTPQGGILVPDEAGIKVDPVKFRVVAEMFGLG